MPILPSVLSFEEISGSINDYSEIVDPTTDLPANSDNMTRASVAAMSRMSPRAYVEWVNDGTSGTISYFDSVVGNADIHKPTITKQDTGIWRFTFPAFVTDLMGVSQAWNFRNGEGSALHNEPIHCQVIRVAPNIVDMYMWIMPSAIPSDVATATLLLRVY